MATRTEQKARTKQAILDGCAGLAAAGAKVGGAGLKAAAVR